MTQHLIKSSQHCSGELIHPRRVFVLSLNVDAVIGDCLSRERARSLQPVLISFVLDVRDKDLLETDTIESVVCYEKLIKMIQRLCNSERFLTFSELAERIAKLCLRDARALNVRVRVEKSDVIHENYPIGVEVVRHRTDVD
jgi:dihydroneopterin aldolase